MASFLTKLAKLVRGGSPQGQQTRAREPFVADGKIAIQYFVEGAQLFDPRTVTTPVRVVTQGLSKFDRPEFELVGVPTEMNTEAAMVLNRIAEDTVNTKALRDGDNWVSLLSGGLTVGGQLKSMTSFGHPFLRLTDASTRPDDPARTALAAMAVSRARARHEAGERDDATAILKRSIAWFPGEALSGTAPPAAANLNANNSLAYFTLSAWGEDVDRNYSAAVTRSEALVAAELGGPLPRAVERGVLEADAAALLDALQTQSIGLESIESALEAGQPVTLLLSPIVQIKGGAVCVTLPIGPVSYRRYFFEGPVQDRLRAPDIGRLAAEIYGKWVERPSVVLERTRDVAVDVYETGFCFELEMPSQALLGFESAGAGSDHLPMLSRIIASLGRELAAGLSLDEIKARWEINTSAAAHESGLVKLRSLAEQEARELSQQKLGVRKHLQ